MSDAAVLPDAKPDEAAVPATAPEPQPAGGPASLPEEAAYIVDVVDKRLEPFLDTLRQRSNAKRIAWESHFTKVADAIAAVQSRIDAEADARARAMEQLRSTMEARIVAMEADIRQRLDQAETAIRTRIADLSESIASVGEKAQTGRLELGDVIESRSMAILAELRAFDNDYCNQIADRRRAERQIAEIADQTREAIVRDQSDAFDVGDRGLSGVRERFRTLNEAMVEEGRQVSEQIRRRSAQLRSALDAESDDCHRCHDQFLDQIPLIVNRLRSGIQLIS